MAATQREALQVFTALLLSGSAGPGSLLACIGLNDAGRALALASMAAGSASIFFEEDPAALREAQREGCCTFAVNSLDEALRIVKNEIRQRRPIAVGLSGNPAAWLAEMAERGVQPQCFATSRELTAGEAIAARVLRGRGMQTLGGLGLHAGGGAVDLETALQRVRGGWTMQQHEASGWPERREQDKLLIAAAGENNDPFSGTATQWMRAAPVLFPRALERWYWRAGASPST